MSQEFYEKSDKAASCSLTIKNEPNGTKTQNALLMNAIPISSL